MCIGGDVTQIDLGPGKSGLLRAMNMLRSVDDVGSIELNRGDIIRHPLVEKIVKAFENDRGGEPTREVQGKK